MKRALLAAALLLTAPSAYAQQDPAPAPSVLVTWGSGAPAPTSPPTLAPATSPTQPPPAKPKSPNVVPTPPPSVVAPSSHPETRAPTGQPGAQSQETDSDESSSSFWARGRTRKFFATTIDVGYLYLRPRASFGYGKPFWRWVGIDLNPAVSSHYLAAYGGLRFALPFVEARLGARYTFDLQQYYLIPAPEFNRLSFESQALERSTYTNIEAEVSGGVPLGPGSVLAIASGTYMTGVPNNVLVYDDTLRVITRPPWIWRGRLGYAVRLGVEGKISLAVVADLLGSPDRGSMVFRAGFVGSAVMRSACSR